jgi:hypothetical protein
VSFASDPELARRAAAVRRRCGWCDELLRPCNLGRHIEAHHFRQLSIDDELRRFVLDCSGVMSDEAEQGPRAPRDLLDPLGGAVFPDDDQAARWSEWHVEENF